MTTIKQSHVVIAAVNNKKAAYSPIRPTYSKKVDLPEWIVLTFFVTLFFFFFYIKDAPNFPVSWC